jgi:pyruvyl transferase EpsI
LIEKCVGTIKETGCDVVLFGYVSEDENNKIIHNIRFPQKIYELNTAQEHIDYLVKNQVEHSRIGWNAWCRFFRAELIQKNKLDFPDNKLVFAEDMAFAFRTAMVQKKMVVLPDILYHYVQRSNSIMGMTKRNPIEKFVSLCLDFEKFVNKIGYKKKFESVKAAFFLKILYGELKKETDNYREMSCIFEKMPDSLKQTVIMWGKQCARHFLISIRMYGIRFYCVMQLACTMSEGKNEKAKVEFWILKLMNGLKHFLPGVISKIVKTGIDIITPCFPQKKNIRNQRVFLIGTEDWGNLGDHHIAVSELNYLKKYFNEIVEIPASEYFSRKSWLLRHICYRDIIFLHGGGNLGNVYMGAEVIRENVIKHWPHNCKCILPQTAYYTENQEGKEVLQHDVNLLTAENNIFIVAREKKSYQFLKENFRCRVFLTPDIVLSSKYQSSFDDREDIGLLCLRNDIEKKLSDENHQELKTLLLQYTACVKFIDTQKEYKISVKNRKAELLEFIEMFQRARIIITDRLHGMVFSAITGTPCIVFENYNHKVRGTYQWICDLPYIKLANNMEEAKKFLNTDFWKKEYDYNVDTLLPKYSVILEELKKQYYDKNR